jgi:homoserine kinase
MCREIEIRVPASTSNLGPGFDTIGLALELYNTFVFTTGPEVDGTSITIEGQGAGALETGSDNRAHRSMAAVFDSFGLKVPPVHIHQYNEIPLARGLGGSATAVLAGVMAAYAILDKDPAVDDVLAQSTKVENHPDNLTPSLVGGLTVSTMEPGHITYLKVPVPSQLSCVVYVPDVPMLTDKARQVLPQKVPFEDAVFNVRASSMLIAALATGSLEKLSIAMQDRLHQPYRVPLFPAMNEIFEAALGAGALGVALSGAGSGIFAFVVDNPRGVGQAMKLAGDAHELGGSSRLLPIQHDGATIVRNEHLN